MKQPLFSICLNCLWKLHSKLHNFGFNPLTCVLYLMRHLICCSRLVADKVANDDAQSNNKLKTVDICISASSASLEVNCE